jgi:cardiolipin synthase
LQRHQRGIAAGGGGIHRDAALGHQFVQRVAARDRQHHAQRALYGDLLAAGIEIHEYTASFLHAKVAVIDGRWATVGSSNIDPYSLLLAREANVAIHDAGFAAQLHAELERALATRSTALDRAAYAHRPWWQRARDALAYAVLRWAAVVLARGRDY